MTLIDQALSLLEQIAAEAEREYARAEAGEYPRPAEEEQRVRELHARSIEWDLARLVAAAASGDEESRELLAGMPVGSLERMFAPAERGTRGPCTRCGHRWTVVGSPSKRPKCCARCKSPYWDRPRGAVPRGRRRVS